MARLVWLSSDVMSEVFRNFAQWFSTIEHSNMLQGWYEEFQLEQDYSSQSIKLQKSLAYAAHRFDPASKPFAICIFDIASGCFDSCESLQREEAVCCRTGCRQIPALHFWCCWLRASGFSWNAL